MGLDSFALVTTEQNWNNNDCSPFDSKKAAEFFYWRKHHDLDDWMREEWFRTVDESNEEQFNCIPFKLTKELLMNLRHDCEIGRLYTHCDDYDIQAYQEKDFKFIEQAYKFLEEGLVVYYYCWW